VPVTVATAGVVVVVGAERVRVGRVVQLVAPVKLIPDTLVPVRTAVAVGLLVQVPLTVTVGGVVYPVPPLVIVAAIPVILSRAIAPVPYGPVPTVVEIGFTSFSHSTLSDCSPPHLFSPLSPVPLSSEVKFL